MSRIFACSAVLAVAVSAGLVRAEDKAGAADQQAAAAASPQAQPAAATEEAAAQSPAHAFVMDAHNDNLFEIKAGQIAQERAQSAEVKQFAQMLITDHQKADEKLQQLARGVGVTLGDELDQMHQMKLQKMQKCPSADFDRKYVVGQAAGHTMDVLEFTYQAKHAANDQVKQFAMQTLPTLEQHRQHAMRLAQAQVGAGGEAQPAAARVGGASESGERGSDRGAAQPSDRATTPERGAADSSSEQRDETKSEKK